MNYLDIKKKHGLSTSESETKKKTTSGSASYSEIAKKHGVSYDVDDNYISTFFSDYNKFASADKDSSFDTWKELDFGSSYKIKTNIQPIGRFKIGMTHHRHIRPITKHLLRLLLSHSKRQCERLPILIRKWSK